MGNASGLLCSLHGDQLIDVNETQVNENAFGSY